MAAQAPRRQGWKWGVHVAPFFGDQWFWGDMVARRGAGPKPIPFKQLILERLSEVIDFALRPECREVAQEIANSMDRENGCEAGAGSFHTALRLEQSGNRCAVCPERISCWKIRKPPSSSKKSSESRSSLLNDDSSEIKLSAIAATVLVRKKKIDTHDLELLRPFEYDNSKANVPWDPVSSLLVNTTSTPSNVLVGVAAGPREAYCTNKSMPPKRVRKPNDNMLAVGAVCRAHQMHELSALLLNH
jgi:hypothetical protein